MIHRGYDRAEALTDLRKQCNLSLHIMPFYVSSWVCFCKAKILISDAAVISVTAVTVGFEVGHHELVQSDTRHALLYRRMSQ